PRAGLLPTTTVSHDRIVNTTWTGHQAQTPGKLHVFHQGNFPEATQCLEYLAADKHRLISGTDSGQPGTLVHKPGNHPVQQAVATQPDIKPSPALMTGMEILERLKRLLRQPRVRM